MVDIHSYKIETAVQAGKTFVIKSLNHRSYKSRLVFSICQVPHTIWRVCGNWGSQSLGNQILCGGTW
jgi:hypothetical protein